MHTAFPVLVLSPTFPLSFACHPVEAPHAPPEVTSGRRAVFGAWSAHKTGVVRDVEQKSFKKRPDIAISFWAFCLQFFLRCKFLKWSSPRCGGILGISTPSATWCGFFRYNLFPPLDFLSYMKRTDIEMTLTWIQGRVQSWLKNWYLDLTRKSPFQPFLSC